MSLISKRRPLLVAVGQGMLPALALTGVVRFGYFVVVGSKLPPSMAGSLFLAATAIAGAVSVLLYARSQKSIQASVAAAPVVTHT